jgi:IclR family transcriptional regulator, acetate operon repressor
MRNVDTTLKVLEEVAMRQPVGVSELARALGLPKTTVQRALTTLAAADWIAPSEQGRSAWVLTIRPLTVGGSAMHPQARLRSAAVPVMEELRRATDETVHLNLYYRTTTVLIERLDGLLPVKVFNAFGATLTLHPTAAGRMLLAYLSEAELDAYFAGPFPADYPCPPEHAASLRAAAVDNRRRGFSLTLGGVFTGVNAVAAPIFGRDERPIAAVSVSAPAERMSQAMCESRGPAVAEAARRISLGLRI